LFIVQYSEHALRDKLVEYLLERKRQLMWEYELNQLERENKNRLADESNDDNDDNDDDNDDDSYERTSKTCFIRDMANIDLILC
jgi:hypothetical protein